MNLYDELCKQARPLMDSFQTDLEHDGRWIKDNPGRAFVHVTRPTGTHIFGLPCTEELIADTRQPYLFAEARPSEIYQQVAEVLRGQLAQSGVLWLHFDGARLHRRSAKRCAEIYETQLRSALAKAATLRKQNIARVA